MLGYTQMAGLYARSMVVGMKITMRVTIASASTNEAVVLYAKRYPFITGTGPPNTTANLLRDMAMPNPHSKWKTVNQATDKTVTLTMTANPKKLYSRGSFLDTEQFSAYNGFLPASEARITMGIASTFTGVNLPQVRCDFDIQYTVLWIEKIDIT